MTPGVIGSRVSSCVTNRNTASGMRFVSSDFEHIIIQMAGLFDPCTNIWCLCGQTNCFYNTSVVHFGSLMASVAIVFGFLCVNCSESVLDWTLMISDRCTSFWCNLRLFSTNKHHRLISLSLSLSLSPHCARGINRSSQSAPHLYELTLMCVTSEWRQFQSRRDPWNNAWSLSLSLSK